MTQLSRLVLFVALVAIVALMFSLFRRLGLGELALIAAVLALAFVVEIVRYVVKQFQKGYRGVDRPEINVRAKKKTSDGSG